MLTLLRGMPGSGKTSFMWSVVGDMLENVVELATDKWFMDRWGVYKFNGSKLGEYHAACLESARVAMSEGERVWVHNTFSCRWEMEPYLVLAKEFSYRVDVIDLYDGGLTDEELHERGEHDVPVENIAKMREHWEPDWKNGNPIPPWERPKEPTFIQELGISNIAATIASGTDPIHEAEEAERLDLSIKEVTDEEFEKARNSIPDEKYKIDLDDRQHEEKKS
jgi:predicted kinase